MTSLDLRPLTLGEILDRAFLLYRRHFVLFTGITAIPAVLTLAFGLTRIFFFGGSQESVSGRAPNGFPRFDSISLLFVLAQLIVAVLTYALSQGGTISAVTELYLGRSTSIGASFRRAWSELGTLIGTSLLSGIVVVVASLFLLIPGIYVGCRMLICLPIALVENRGPRDALSRSWNLTTGYAGRSFLVILIYIAVALGIALLVTVPISVAALLQHDASTTRMYLAFNQIASVLANIVTTPLLLIATSIYYFDLRVRKEGFDLQFLIDPTSEHMTRGGTDVPSIL